MKKLWRDRLPDVEREKILNLSRQVLEQEEGSKAIAYLKSDKRRFTDKQIEIIKDRFHIGYMPEHVMNVNGVSHEFSGRMVIPIYDQYDNLVALSSRDWREGAKRKFFHESFPKSNILYGLNAAKKHIIEKKKVIVVEGEFDVQYLSASGFTFTVGVMSSTLKMSHIAMLSRYCREIFLVFDGDTAGEKAAEKVVKMAKERRFDIFQINIIPVIMPHKKDPDVFVNENGSQEFIELLRECRENSKEII